MKKILLLLLMLLITSIAHPLTYYVKNGGNNSLDGKSDANAWETIAKVNGAASTLAPGDSILFKRGSLWREQLSLPENGTSDLWYYYGAYGDTADGYPVIDGSDNYSSSVGYEWHLSSAGTGEYYLTAVGGTTPSITANPTYIWINDRIYADKTVGSLTYYEYDYGNNDGLAFNTVYVKPYDTTGMKVEIKKRANCVYTQRTYNMVDSIKMTHSETGFRITSGKTRISRCYVKNNGSFGLLSSSDSNEIITNYFDKSTFNSYGLSVAGTGKSIIANNLFTGSTASAISCTNTDTVWIIGNTFVGNSGTNVYGTATGLVMMIRNNTFSGVGAGLLESTYAARIGTGYYVYQYNNTLPNGRNPANMLNGITEGTGCINTDPKFVKTRNRGFFCMTMDDYLQDMVYYNETKQYYVDNGITYNYTLHRTDVMKATDWTTVMADQSQYLNFSLQTRDHVKLTQDTAFVIRYVGSGSAATMTISNNYGTRTGTLTTECTGAPGDNLNLDLGTTYYRIGNNTVDLIKYINDLPAYEATLYETYNYYSKSILLNNITTQDIKTNAYNVMYNVTNKRIEEIDSNLTDFKDHGLSPLVLAYPTGFSNDEIRRHVKAAGLKAGRGVTSLRTNTDSINIYNLSCVGNIFEVADADLPKRVYGILSCIDYCGGFSCDLQHQNTNYNHSLITSLYAGYSGRVSSNMDTAAMFVWNNGVTVPGDSIVWWLSQPDSSDYRLRPNSDLAGAGSIAAIPLVKNLYNMSGERQVDENRNVIVDRVNIGAYGLSSPDSATITITENIPAGGTYTLDPVATDNKYQSGTSVEINATAASGYKWIANDTMTTNPYTVVVGYNDTTVGISWEMIPVPIIDTFICHVMRDSIHGEYTRNLDTLTAYGSNFSTIDTFFQNSTGTLWFKIVQQWDDSAWVIPAAGSPRGYYSPWINRTDGVNSARKTRGIRVLIPGGL